MLDQFPIMHLIRALPSSSSSRFFFARASIITHLFASAAYLHVDVDADAKRTEQISADFGELRRRQQN
jgi:hypothetical protein